MSISTQQLKKILGSFSAAVAKDVSGIKTEYATKKDVEGLAKTTDVETTYAKKSELPNVSGLATKQEVTEAVAGVQVPSIEGLAKVTDVDAKLATKADVSAIPNISNLATKEEVSAVDNKLATKADASAIPSIEGLAKTTEVETKLADYAKKAELPSIEGLAKATEIESAYAKKTELPDVSRLVTKTELSDATVNLATKSEVGVIEGRLTEFLPKSGAASLFAQRAELNDYLRKDDVSDVSVTKEAYDAKVQELESEISTLKAKLAAVASGTTEQRPTENLVVGQQYFDTTLGVPVYWNGTEWHNPFASITTVEVEPH